MAMAEPTQTGPDDDHIGGRRDDNAVIRPFTLAAGPTNRWPQEPEGDMHVINGFKTSAEEEVDKHRKVLDGLMEETAEAHGDLDAGLTTEAQDAGAYAAAIDDNDVARHNSSAGWAAPRRLSEFKLVVVTALAWLVWFAINTFALAHLAIGTLFTRGPLAALTTAVVAPILAAAIGAGSALSARLAGRAGKDIAYTPGEFLDPDMSSNKKALQRATVIGVAIEVFTGLVRVLAVHSIVTAVLLFGVSMAVWIGLRQASYEHRSREIERLKSTSAAMKKAGLNLADDRADLRADWGRVDSLHGQIRGHGEKVVNIVNSMWSQTVTAYRHHNPGASVPVMPVPHGYQTFRDLAAGHLPQHLDLEPLAFTDVEKLRKHPRDPRPSTGGEWPLELGPGTRP